MCAIAGILRPSAPDSLKSEVERMTVSLAHRGPDGTGLLIQRGVALGHRRLAIIDLEGSAQPMLTADGRLALTYNGEIYNYRELRRELEAKGHRFRTSGDTEVVLHAYREWGDDCPKHLRGMFAFAIHDREKQTVFLARDHFGIKPLYYRTGDNYFAFASEIGALLEIDAPAPTGRLDAIDAFLRYQYIPEPATIYHEISALPKGSTLSIKEDTFSSPPEPRVYWRPVFTPAPDDDSRTLTDYTDEFAALLDESTSAHMVADVPFGSFLSGGIDSSLVTAAMGKFQPKAGAFCLDLPNSDASELRYAQEAAKQIGCDLTSAMAENQFLETLEELLPRFGQPFGDSSMIPTFQVSKLARKEVPMVLSGDGGDEGFGGYFWHQAWGNQSGKAYFNRALASPRSHVGQFLRYIIAATKDQGGHRFERWQRLALGLPLAELSALWRPDREPARHEIDAELFAASKRHAHLPSTSFAQAMDYEGYLPSNILRKTDTASMACGLEVRTPLIDLRMFELIAKLPEPFKFAPSGANRAGEIKRVPKALLRRQFPADFVERPKKGFGMPLAHLLLESTKTSKELDHLLNDPKSPLASLFSAEALSPTKEEANASTRWLLLVLGKWMNSAPNVSFS